MTQRLHLDLLEAYVPDREYCEEYTLSKTNVNSQSENFSADPLFDYVQRLAGFNIA